MSSSSQSAQISGRSWLETGGELLPPHMLNFFARRRIAISLIGFTGLVAYNLLVRQAVPYNPFDFTNPWVLVAAVLLVAGLAIRSWSAGTLNKSRELTTWGPYALTRNPLYIGSFLMMFAFCIVCRDWLTLAFAIGPMAMLYSIQVLFEEKRLEGMFPAEWSAYKASTPRFFPNKFSRQALVGWKQFEWLRNREYRTIAACGLGVTAIYGLHWWLSQQV